MNQSDLPLDIFAAKTEIEASLVIQYMPFFLAVDVIQEDEGVTFDVILGSSRFKGMSVNSRIAEVLTLLRENEPEIFKAGNVVVEVFDQYEFSDLIDGEFV